MSALALSPRRWRRVTSVLLTALTYLILIVMLAPIAWLIIGATQTSGTISNGTYHVLHPTLHAFSAMWKSVDFGHYFANSLIICSLAALFATVLASVSVAPPAGYGTNNQSARCWRMTAPALCRLAMSCTTSRFFNPSSVRPTPSTFAAAADSLARVSTDPCGVGSPLVMSTM